MSKSFPRFFLFTAGGTLILSLWAGILGGALGIPLFFIARDVYSEESVTLFRTLLKFGKAMMFPACPLSFLLFGAASFSTPHREKAFQQLVRFGMLRSLISTLGLGLAGSLTTTVMGLTTTQFSRDPAPAYVYGAVAGWMVGVPLGIFWGIVEGVLRLRKASANSAVKPNARPIATP